MGAAAIGGAIKRSIADASRIRDESMRLGITPELFQELDFAAKQTGASMEDVASALRQIAKAQVAALKGGEMSDAAKVFERRGVEFEKLKMMKPHELFRLLGEHVKGAQINSLLLDDALAIVGKTGLNVIPAMIEGLDDLAEAIHDAGAILSDEDTFKLAEVGDKFTTLFAQFKVGISTALSPVLDIIDTIVTRWEKLFGFIAGFYEAVSSGQSFKDAIKQGVQVWEQTEKDKEAEKEGKKARREARAKIQAASVNIDDVIREAEDDKKAQDAPDVPHVTRASISSDALTAIGNFLGSSMRNDMERRSLDKLTRIEQHTGRMSRLIEQPDTGTQFP